MTTGRSARARDEAIGWGSAVLRGLLAGAVVAALGATAASAAVLKVDDDNMQCATAAYATIQDAVAAASAGDTIKVCPGTYGGQVVIDKSLKIKGKAPKYKECNTLATPDPALHSIFEAPTATGLAGIGIDVFADKVTIQGMVIAHAGETGIRTDPAHTAFAMRKNVLLENANGVYFHSSGGSASSIKANCFRSNTLAGIRTRYGLADATISKNLFFATAQAAAIIVDQEPGSTTERLAVTSNKSLDDSTFAVIVGTVDSIFKKNTVDSTLGTAIFVGGNNVGLTITGNTVRNAGTRGIRFNTGVFGGSASATVVVSKNVVDKAGSHGIAVDSMAGESALESSTITRNVVTDSGQNGSGDGIRIDDPAATGANGGNSVTTNTISGSFNHDCHDSTAGGGTAGTANTWTGDTAATQNVANLCFTGAANGVAD